MRKKCVNGARNAFQKKTTVKKKKQLAMTYVCVIVAINETLNKKRITQMVLKVCKHHLRIEKLQCDINRTTQLAKCANTFIRTPLLLRQIYSTVCSALRKSHTYTYICTTT